MARWRLGISAPAWGAVPARESRCHPTHRQASPSPWPLLPSPVSSMCVQLCIRGFIWQNSSLLFRVKWLCLVTATVSPNRKEGKKKKKKATRDGQQFPSLIQSSPPPSKRGVSRLLCAHTGLSQRVGDPTWPVSAGGRQSSSFLICHSGCMSVTLRGPALPLIRGSRGWGLVWPIYSLATTMFNFHGRRHQPTLSRELALVPP